MADNVMFTREASEIGLKPGEWPEYITFNGQTWQRRARDCTEDGELLAVKYQHTNSRHELVVLND
jgi:hypothetical protein